MLRNIPLEEKLDWNHLGESFKVDVPFAMYNDKIADDQMSMKITSVVRINTSQKSFCDTLDFQMTNPSCVEIEVRFSGCILPKRLDPEPQPHIYLWQFYFHKFIYEISSSTVKEVQYTNPWTLQSVSVILFQNLYQTFTSQLKVLVWLCHQHRN